MNKIFKVIYSKTRHCYVVVSELAKSHCKTTQSHTVRSKAALTAAVLLALGAFSFVGMPVAQAADGTESLKNNDYVGANGYYWYFDEKTNQWTKYPYKLSSINNNRSWQELPNYKGGGAKEPGAVTAGLYAQAGEQTITIGNRNAGQSKGSVFIGELDRYNDGGKNDPVGMRNNYVTAVGFQSNATGWGSIAIGSNAVAENTQETSQVVDYEGSAGTSGTVQDDNYGIKLKPSIKWSSVALGYSAQAKDGNIAIGANSEATSTDKGDSYVSVGNGTLKRRITNVAKGTDNSDVVTVGQMNDAIKQADNLNVNAGWGINVADEKDTTGKVTKKVISLKHNLGTGYNDDEANGMIIGGLVEDRDNTKQYGAADANSVIVGAGKALASGKSSVVVGGLDNVASGATSVVVGGDNNNAAGNQSAVFGGRDNTAAGIASTAGGGIMNVANGQQAVALGGAYNYALGTSSTAIGGTGGNGMYGYSTSVNGNYSVSLAGGSTGTDALNGLAAGNQSVVTTANGTAVGYQATTNKEGTIAFGHDAGDVSGYAVTWKQRTDGKTNADHTTNDYTQVPDSVTPTTYKDAYYNRLVKVADGQDDHDVVVMEQLKNAKNDLKVNAGWGIKVNDVTTQNDDGTETTTKNVISLNRNLGTNYGNLGWGEGKVTFEASGQNSLILGGAASVSEYDHHSDVKAGVYGKDSVLVGGFNNLIGEKGETSVIVGGQENQVTNQKSVIVGGFWNKVTGSTSVVVGGMSNEASGSGDGVFGGFRNKVSGGESVVLGGQTNEVTGMNSVVSGGTDNNVSGHYASANGGKKNTISGNYAATLGGFNNQSTGMFSNAIGGDNNITSGQYSITSGGSGNTASGDNSYIGGGGSNQAAGVGASVFGGYRSKVNGNLSTGVGGGSTNNRATAALAAGYQSMVTDGGVAYRSLTSEEKSKIYKGQQYWPGFSGFLVDNDTKVLDRISTAIGYQATADAPGVISFGHDKGDESSENGRYSSAYYNRLVKAADGIDAHDAVVMEQLKLYTKSDASNVGANLKTYTVGDDGETITETDASNTAKTTNENAWGTALGTGKIADSTESDKNNPKTNGSLQLVTGGTVYSYNKPVAVPDKTLQYVKEGKTTGENLGILDATLNDKNHNIKYYAVDETTLPKLTNFNGKDYSNEKNDGAKGMGSMAAGFNTHADGIASTVAGSYSGVINQNGNGLDLRGATALSYGTFNINQNTDTQKAYSGVANSIVGQANMTTNSNAAIIYGAGNTVTNSYRRIDPKKAGAIRDNVSDPAKLSKAMQDAVKESGGQVMVMGGGNSVDNAYMTQIVGVGNNVKGTNTNKNKKIASEYDSSASTQYNYVDGFQNTLTNGKNDYIIGANNSVTGDSIDKNQSNIVVGDNHTLNNEKNNVVLGSADSSKELAASGAVVIGHNADVSVDNGVALGSDSVASVKEGQKGYDPAATVINKTTAPWTSTKAAVSVGKADGSVTRQITGVAAGTNDTDAVNVAQIKKLASIDASNIGQNFKNGDVTANENAWGEALGTGTVTDGSKQLVTGDTVYKALNGGMTKMIIGTPGKNGKDGTPGTIGLVGPAGMNGKDGAVDITIQKGEDGNDGTKGANGVDGKAGINRIVYEDKNGKHQVATMEDGLKFAGDDGQNDATKAITKKLNNTVDIIGGADSAKLTANNIGVNNVDGKLKIQLAKNLAGITSIANQTTTGKGDAQTTTGAKIDLKDDGSISVNSGKITDVKSGLTATDGTYADTDKNNAANIGDVHSMIEKEAGNTDDKLALKANVAADNIGTHITDTTAQKTNLDNWGAAIGTGAVADSTNEHANQLVTGKTVYDALHGGLDNITVGKDGKDGKDGSIGIAGQNGKDGYSITYIKTEQGAAGVDGKDGITRVVYQDKDGNGKHTFATLDDGLKFKGDDSMVIARKLNEQLNITGGADSTKLTDKNIGVNSSTDGLKIQLAKDLTSITSISGSTDDKGAKITLDTTDKNISLNGGSIKDVASNLTKDGKIINGSDNNAASISDVQTLVQQGVDNGYTNGNGITIQKDGTSGKNVISVNQGDGLKFDKGKLAVDAGNGLKIDNGAVAIKTSDSNLKVDSNGIGLSNKITIGSDKTKQVTIDGTKGEISGLTNTTWDSKANDYSKSTKAATESQVDAAVKDAVKQAGDNDVDTHVKAGSYGVDANHQVSMDIVDKNGKATGKKVTITDVATHTEVGDVTKLDKGIQNASGTTSVVDAINNVNTSMNTKIGDQNYSTSNTSGSNKYVQDGDSITSAIGKLDGAVQQAASAAGKHSTVSEGSNIKVNGNVQNDGHTDYKVSLKDDISLNSVTTKSATTDTLTVNNSATIGGVTIANKTISGLDDTKIEKGSTNAVNAGTIWNELRPSGGTYINQNNTTAQNITNLDTQVKKNSDLVNSDGSTIKIGSKDSATKVDISDKNGSGRVVTGVVTDTNDASSAANVGYVNNMAAANTQQIYRDMNRAYGSLNNNINRAAAGSNALAALHPLDFDPADKASFAVGYGHYRNANAAAVGAFYQPNANTMVNMGISLGNGDPGFNAGVSFKIGKGSAYNGVSKAEMAQTIHDQATEISAIKADDAAKDKRIDALEKENQEMKKQIQEILARLNG